MTGVLTNGALALHFGTAPIAVESEDRQLIDRLRRYFRGFAAELTRDSHPHSRLVAIEEPETAPVENLLPWSPEGKDAFVDLPSGRIVRKMRTGVSISMREDTWTSSWTIRGPLNRNFSQVVNVIGALHGLTLLDRGAAMVHASAVCDADGRTVAVAGQSGMGKSSVAVRLMEAGLDYISNDRLLFEALRQNDGVIAHGLPKLPRVNPGTLLGGERTRLVLRPEAAHRYERMPKDELWQVEDKYDLEVGSVLGRRWLLSGRLSCILVLSWRLGGGGLELQRLSAGQALQELRGVAKSLGVFDARLAERRDSALIETVRRTPVYRVTGESDPARLAAEISANLDRYAA